jgi:hypothetical protein
MLRSLAATTEASRVAGLTRATALTGTFVSASTLSATSAPAEPPTSPSGPAIPSSTLSPAASSATRSTRGVPASASSQSRKMISTFACGSLVAAPSRVVALPWRRSPGGARAPPPSHTAPTGRRPRPVVPPAGASRAGGLRARGEAAF